MLAMLLVLCSSLSGEIAQSMGKQSIRKHRETVYNLAFLELFWGFIVMLGIVIFVGNQHFSWASLPTMMPRVAVELLAAYLSAEAIVRADRSTIGFLRLLGIPLLLVVDIVLGYHLSLLQIVGVLIMFFALILAFHRNPSGKRGSWVVVLNALAAVVAVSLYKYDITHYNSVAIEQAIVLGFVMTFFFLKSGRKRSPLRLLTRPTTGTQALLSGLSWVMGSFAVSFAPASVVVAMRRTFGLFWAILFGQTYFHEHSIKRKLYSFGFTAIGIMLLVSPYWPHWHWL